MNAGPPDAARRAAVSGGGPAVPAGDATARPSDESGSVVLWLLGLCVVLLFVGGLSLDLWRAFTERRALAVAVDAAAVAGASGIDVAAFRRSGTVVLDPPAAEALAASNLAAQSGLGAMTDVTVSAVPAAITVEATGAVDLTLTKVLLDAAPLTIRVTATAEPHRSP